MEKLLLVEVRALADKVETRLAGMDKAIDLIHQAATRVPSDVDLKVGNMRELIMQRFDAINMQFGERDKRFEIAAHDKSLAIDAALQAQKESAAKVEEGFRREIETLSKLVDTKTEGLRARLDTIQSFQQRMGLETGQ